MRVLALIVLLAAALTAHAEVDRTTQIFDSTIVMPPGWPEENPFNILYSMNCSIKPALDHNGQPHKHGHLIQLIMDGGNRLQDPPNPDGSPGGDDSLAFGNYNLLLLLGLDGLDNYNERTGTFFSKKHFVPLIPSRSYYLRLWEGNDPKTAPYYNDTVEYVTQDDRGGSMIQPKPGLPVDVDWAFGPSKPRPAPLKNEKAKKPAKK